MTTASSETIQAPPSPVRLPEHWPDAEPVQPVRPVWIPWPIAVILAPLFWLLPKRLGPHFAAVRWPGVIIAHLVWTIYGIGNIVIAFDRPRDFSWVAYAAGRTPGFEPDAVWPTTLWDIVLSPLALLAHLIAEVIDDAEELLIAFAAFLGTEAAVVLVAALLMPFAAAGERSRRLFGRCVKLTLWSTTSLIVIGLAVQVIELELFEWPGAREDDLLIIASCAYVTWFLWIWIRSGMRYGGPVEGPGWQPRPPTCESCGYRITGLTRADRCPECGEPVADSLPETREPSAFAAAPHVIARIRAFGRTAARALAGRDFYKRLAMRNAHGDARRFAIWVCIAAGPVLMFTFLAAAGVADVWPDIAGASPHLLETFAGVALTWLTTSGSVLLGIGLLALIEARMGYAPIQRASTVVFYWSIWALPILCAGVVVTVFVVWLADQPFLRGTVPVWPLGRVDKDLVYIPAPYLAVLAVLVVGLIRLIRATRQTRFANA